MWLRFAEELPVLLEFPAWEAEHLAACHFSEELELKGVMPARFRDSFVKNN